MEDKEYIAYLLCENRKLEEKIKQLNKEKEEIDNVRATYWIWNDSKKERIEDAIQYLNEHIIVEENGPLSYPYTIVDFDKSELLKILRGDKAKEE